MEIKNFENVCSSYWFANNFKKDCERVLNILQENAREMTATEIMQITVLENIDAISVQKINHCLKKLIALNLVSRRENFSGKNIKIQIQAGLGTLPVYNNNGNLIGKVRVWHDTYEKEIREKKILFSIKNT